MEPIISGDGERSNTRGNQGNGQICFDLDSYTVVPRFTIAPHYDETALRRNCITAIFLRLQLRSQNNGLNGVFSLCDDWFPASGTDSSQNDDFPPADQWFQNGTRVNKMAPRCVFGQIPRKTATENGRPMEDLHWTVSCLLYTSPSPRD